jgi:TnpA family transposase
MARYSSDVPKELFDLASDKPYKYRLFFVLYLKHYQRCNEFFTNLPKFSRSLLISISARLDVKTQINIPSDKTLHNYRQEIRDYSKTQVLSSEHNKLVSDYIIELMHSHKTFRNEHIKNKVYDFLYKNKIEKVSDYTLTNIIKNIRYKYEQEYLESISQSLDNQTKAFLDGLMLNHDKSISRFKYIKRWPKGLSADTVKKEAEKLEFLLSLNLPKSIVEIAESELNRQYRNICSKYPHAIKKMPEIRRYGLLSIFCHIRKRELIDSFVDILIRVTHQIFNSAEKRLIKELGASTNIKQSYSRKSILNLLIDTIFSHEDNIVKEAIYSVISKNQLKKIRSKSEGDYQIGYKDIIYLKARKSYVGYYRRILSPIIKLLNFNTNNKNYKNFIEALSHIKDNLDQSSTFYKDLPPIDKVIKSSYQQHVIEENDSGEHVKRIDYELCTLHNLRNKLRVKEIWLKNAYLYRDPENDLPQDFESIREDYYNLLNQPISEKSFTTKLKKALTKNLNQFNKSIISNKYVSITRKNNKSHIKLEKLIKQNEPPQLNKIKKEVTQKWSNTSLLDVLKEADVLTDFINEFYYIGDKEILDKEIVKQRLLLAILGYGTNTGLKSVSAGSNNVSYSELQYIKDRYFDPDNLREAIRKMINYLLSIQVPEVWENCSTSLASDSTHFKASDQNLMSQFHPRYRNTGVMVYWHVDRNSICIYSQLKSCLSSEVSSMIEGILRHSSNKRVEKSYVDTHGQSEVGFAFSYILGFKLLPRLSNISKQKLYYTNKNDSSNYNNLTDILSRPIKWNLIEEQYDQIIKYTTALKLGHTNAENIMKRFTANNLKHPVFQALTELGKVIKTIFLCQYLSSINLRREIHEGLNVVERWNGVNDFIFYGNNSKLRSNNPSESELSMLCLHLLQLSMTLINTIMIQKILDESGWISKMTPEDKRAITPLIYEHINPYGEFILDMGTRIFEDL